MLHLNNITKIFNKGTVNEKVALNDFSLHLESGDFLTVVGGNGSGKSTMLNIIAGLLTIDKGNITIDGKDVTKLPEHKRAFLLGRVFQDPMMGTAPHMSIEENLALAMRRGKMRTLRLGNSKTERKVYRDVLAQLNLGLEDRMKTQVGLLSGGQRQALTLLMATLHSPNLLLLDEHTAALDPKTAKTVLELSEQLVMSKQITTIMITHNMKDAIKYGNRVIMMDNGQIIFDASGEEKQKLSAKDMLEMFSTLPN